MNAFDRYFHGRYLALRPYLFSKLFLVMVALDTFLLMIGHAGRYGVAGFNVAHFAWLDVLSPLPTAGLYVGVLLLTGLLSLWVAFVGHTPGRMTLLCLLYSYSWAMSMLDSYQHHYFVSLVMLCMVFFPRVSFREVLDYASPARAARFTTGFGYALLGATISVLYTFTSVAKLDAEWRHGYSLQRISRAGQIFAPLAAQAQALGVSKATFWSFVSSAVIPLELAIAAGYALSVRQDESENRWLKRGVLLTFVLALALHGGAEALDLEIGWFSYYMLVLAGIYLVPSAVYVTAGRLCASALGRFMPEASSASAAASGKRFEVLLMTVTASSVLAAAAYLIELPGAGGAAILAGFGLWGFVLLSLARGRAAEAHRGALAAGLAGMLMAAAISWSDVRWDFYRFLGGDLQRRGESEEALEAYLKGERYAPKGSSRRDKIRQLQRELGR